MLVAGCDSGLSAVALRHDPALRFDALEVFGEELLHRAVEVETVLLVVEAVAFVVLDHLVHMHAAAAQQIGRASCRESV